MKSFAKVSGDPPKKGAHKMKSNRFVITTPETGPETAAADGTYGKPSSKHEQSKSSGQFNSGAAPRVGGKAKPTQGGVPKGGNKKMLVRSKRNVKHNSASPSAKRSAKKLY